MKHSIIEKGEMEKVKATVTLMMFTLTFFLLMTPAAAWDMEANSTSLPSSLLASVKDYGESIFGPKLWNGWVLLTFGVGSSWAWSYPSEGSIIGDELTHHWWNGSKGSYDFTASNEPDFNDVVAYLTNGENDYIWLYHWCDGYGGGQGTSEEWWGIGDPDLAGFDIDFIRLRVNSLSISWLYTEFGTYTHMTHNATWEIWGSLPAPIRATIGVFPSTLSLKSNGKWITAYIELPEDYYASDIGISTVKLNGEIPAELHPTEIGDYDTDDITDLMVKFNRQDLIAILSVGEATLTITGEVNGIQLEGSDTIRVIDE